MDETSSRERTSDTEYAGRIAAIHRTAMEALERGASEEEIDRIVRNGEIDALIEHRLGIHFPSNRRAAVQAVLAEADARRARMADEYESGFLDDTEVRHSAQEIMNGLHDQLRGLLSPEELAMLLPSISLPLDPPPPGIEPG